MPVIPPGGSLNNALADAIYVFEIAPTPAVGQGVPTDLAAIVGTASWGPLNTPMPFADTGSLYATFGTQTTDALNLVTQGVLACQFSNNFLGVRVAQGVTAVAASAVIKDNGGTITGVTLTGFYTGTVGNNISCTFQTGSNSTVGTPTVTAIIQRPGYTVETFPNIVSSTAGAFWANFVSAVNNGINGVRPASVLVTASVGTSILPPVMAATTLSGGVDGLATTAGTQVGTDGGAGSRTGMYSLRGKGIGQFCLAGDTATADWSSIAAFASSEGAIGICHLATGQTISAASTAKNTANLASPYAILLKDSVYFYDTIAGQQRLVTSDGIALGILASLAPEASPLNKPINGVPNIVATELTINSGAAYSTQDLANLKLAGITAISRPIPRGNLYGFVNGQNTYMIPGQDGVEYGRFLSYLARSLVALLGYLIGELQGNSPQDPTRAAALASLTQFLQQLLNYNRIAGFNVVLNTTNNPPSSVAQGLMVANVSVTFMGIVHIFAINLQGGATVVTVSQSQG